MTSFKPGRLAVISLRAEDVPSVVHFYRDVVGLDLVPHHDHWPAFDLNGTYLVIVERATLPGKEAGGPRFPALAFAVEDLDQAVEHLQAHNVDLPWGIESGRSDRWVMFYDPAGNLIEFAEFNQAGSA